MIGIVDLKGFYVLVVLVDIVYFFKLQTEKIFSHFEYPCNYILEFKIGFQFFIVQVEQLLFQFFRIKTTVPFFQSVNAVQVLGEILQLLILPFCGRFCLAQQFV